MSVSFAEGLTIVGALLLGASAVSGLTRRTVLSKAVLAVAAGILLALTGVVELSPRDEGLVVLVELVLLLTLFPMACWSREGLLDRLPEWALAGRYEGLYALGLGLASFGVADLAHGNGLISAFVAGLVFALFVARPASVLLAFTGVHLTRPEKLFIAWFGPKGIASMLFALFILNSTAPDRTLVFDIAAFTILASIVAHGLTDTVAGGWIEQRVGRQ